MFLNDDDDDDDGGDGDGDGAGDGDGDEEVWCGEGFVGGAVGWQRQG